MNPRERLLLMAAIVVLGGVAFKFLIYAPKQVEYAALVQARNAKAAELARNQQILAARDKVQQEYDRLAAFIAEVEAKLPNSKEVPALLTAMERFTHKLGIKLENIRPAPLEAVASGAPAATQESRAVPTLGKEAAAKAIPYSRMQVVLSLSGTFNETFAYLRELRNLPRLVVVNSIIMSPTALPKLGVNLTTEIYVLGTPSPGRP